MNSGWIKLHRKVLSWERYSEHNTTRVFFHCLLSANHKDNKRRGIEIKKGSFITSYGKFAEEVGLSIQQVRTSLDKLKSTSNITTKSTNKHTLITIVGWEKYNDTKENTTSNPTSNGTNEQQTNNNKQEGIEGIEDKNKNIYSKKENLFSGSEGQLNPKQKKEDVIDAPPVASPPPKKKKHLEFVYLADDEYSKLLEIFGQRGLDSAIEILNNYIGSKGKKYKSHYHTILAWNREVVDKRKAKQQEKKKPNTGIDEDIT